MATIQVDMFEVQLGAGLLLQFKTDGGRVVRVLADAGVHASGYSKDHVHRKLAGAFSSLGDGDRRIDLMIGTHYDADHLQGLVPIIEDTSIEITEAWMPPVANDSERNLRGAEPHEGQYLAIQFAEDTGGEKIRSYLNAKREICNRLERADNLALELRPEATNREFRAAFSKNLLRMAPPDESFADELNFFFSQRADAAAATLDAGEHANASVESPVEAASVHARLNELAAPTWPMSGPLFDALGLRGGRFEDMLNARWKSDGLNLEHDLRDIAAIRRAAANDAINAISLNKVVTALRSRRIPIACQTIPDGTPRRFVWREAEKRFVAGQQLTSDGPEFLLLGPSASLVQKHRDRLPIGDYLAYAMIERLPVESITPSNQLSYVARFAFAGQGILVTGDAGCVDFKPNSRAEFFSNLIDALMPLHVIQVAHHAGHNAEFYNVLLAAQYAQQRDKSWLLLSHATEDRTRPSAVFASFIGQARRDGDDMALLFTSRPKAEKVRDYRPIIHPPVGPVADVGDVRLRFGGDGWTVQSHAVQP